MTNTVNSYLDNTMVKIPTGEVELRDDRKKTKWKVEIKTFLLAQYPVTVELYSAITKKTPYSYIGNEKPLVNISWNDAVLFCNLLSKEAGLTECYSR